ncbi:MAG TPA: ABC transporter permease [Caulobacteraceae bacterium]|nr:ABC transporter permease [Caulobacteraceae bacterium]
MTGPPPWRPSGGRLARLVALTVKETRQVYRDPSFIAVGLVLPVILILLFGYGLSLDVRHVPLAIVLEDSSPDARDLASSFQLSPYFDAHLVGSMESGRTLMLAGRVDGVIRIPPDFSRRRAQGDGEAQLIVSGADANFARIVQGYADGVVANWTAQHAGRGERPAAGPVLVEDRVWFNNANNSAYFLVPGLIVLIMTLIGALLTALVMAREWERGTLEALFVTPVRVGEIIASKVIPYFGLGMLGLALCVVAARFLFGVPLRGSLAALVAASVLYLLVALALGLFISSTLKSQFVASLVTVVVAFLPALMLSGFLFDLRSLPLVVRLITYVFPGRYYVALLQTLFLAGDVWPVILPNMAVLAAMATVLFSLTRLVTRKQIA